MPKVHAIDIYGTGTYGNSTYGIVEVDVDETPDEPDDEPLPEPENVPLVLRGGGGGGGGALTGDIVTYTPSKEGCSTNLDCKPGQQCIHNICYDAECISNADCLANEICWNLKCVKLFDLEIKAIDTLVNLGEPVKFDYFIAGRTNINHDVAVNFWIEKDGKIISSGKDTIYLSQFEEKIKTTELFLPKNVEPGIYTFHIQARFNTYVAESTRIIEIVVEDDSIKINLIAEEDIDDFLHNVTIVLMGMALFSGALMLSWKINMLKFNKKKPKVK